MSLRRAGGLVAGVLFLLLGVSAAQPAVVGATQTILVNTTQDVGDISGDGLCSLRGAIDVSLANSNAAETDCTTGLPNTLDQIQIAPSLAGHTLLLDSPLPNISDDSTNPIEIIGPTTVASDFTISGRGAHRIFEIGNGAGATPYLTLDNLTVTGGNGTGNIGVNGNGGAIYTMGTVHLTLNNVFITNSHVSQRGGAIYVDGAATLTNNGGAYTDNSAGGDGGAIFTLAGPMTYNGYAMLMENNSSGDKGGAIGLIADPINDFTHIERSLLENNSAANGGGVLYSEPGFIPGETAHTTFELTDSTVTGNSTVNLVSGRHPGAVLLSLDTLERFNYLRDTFVNTGELFDAGGGFMANSIVIGSSCHTQDNVAFFQGSRNLIDGYDPITGHEPGWVDDSHPSDGCVFHTHNPPLMGGIGTVGNRVAPTGVSPTLAQNGGPEVQKTFALSSTSNAIDNGDAAYCGTIDARSIQRGLNGIGDINSPQPGDCDIGAYEYVGYVVNFVTNVSPAGEGDGVHNVQVKLSIPDPTTPSLPAELDVPIVAAGTSTARTPQDYTFASDHVVFPAGSGNGTIVNFPVTITQNDVAGRYAKNIDLALQPASGVAIAEPKSHQVSITDDDRPGVSVNDGGDGTTVSEATPGTADSMSVALKSQPDCIQTDPNNIFSCGAPADVTVQAEPDRDCTISSGGHTGTLGAPLSFTILNADWQSGTPMTVNAVDDLYSEFNRLPLSQFCRITFTFSSGDPLYNATTDVYDVHVTDNDVAGVAIAPNPGNGDIAEGSSATNTWSVVLLTPPDPGKPLPSTARGPTIVTVTPNAACTVGNGAGVAKAFSFTDDNWSTPQTITAAPFDNVTVELLHTCTLSASISSPDPVYQDLGNNPSLIPAMSSFSIQDYSPPTVANDPPFIDVSTAGHSDGLTVSEATSSTADTASFVLERQPLANVKLDLSASSDPRIPTPQVLFQGPGDASQVSTTSLTFTPANWNTAQNVKVFAKDDHFDESAGLNPVTISASVTTTAAGFNDAGLRRFVLDGGTPAATLSVPVTITDNDVSAVNVTESGGSTAVTEGGPSDSFAVALATNPFAAVTLDVSAGAQCTATFAGAPGDGHELTIAAADWATAVHVNVTAVDDAVVEASPKNCAVSLTATSADSLYNHIPIPDVTASVTDNDTAAVLITTAGGVAVSEATPSTADSYAVVLQGQPDDNVTVHVSAADGQTLVYAGGAPASSLDLTFTPANYATPQSVHVVAVDDNLVETSPHVGTIAHSIVTTATGFAAAPITVDGASTSNVSVSITDNDTAPVPPPNPVVAAFTQSPNGGPAPSTVQFDASSSTSPVAIESYHWLFGDGTTGDGITVSHRYRHAGRYFVKLKIVDANGTPAVVTQALHIYAFGWAPPLIAAPGTNTGVAGTGIPISFSVGGWSGLDIRQPPSPVVLRFNCTTGAVIAGSAHRAHRYGTQALTFDATSGLYTYHWQTAARWAGQCREFDLLLAGGVTERLRFHF